MSAKPDNTITRRLSYMTSLFVLSILFLSACQPAPAQTSAPTATLPPAPATSVPAPTSAPSDTPAVQLPAEPTISVVDDPKLGKILVGEKGMTLYMFTKDGPDQSNCDADCLAKWPPLLTQGNPNLGEGVDPALISTATLADGSLIVTYNQMPLYYWVKDAKPGDTSGQDVGHVWYVVSPKGEVVGKEPMISVVEDPKLGKILVGDNGMTLYMFTKDRPDQSNCDLECLAKWPPLLTQGKPNLGEGVDPALIGTATLADGSLIVTYNQMPLYYWVKDSKPGDTTGQDVGHVWYVVSPVGEVVGKEPTISVVEDPKLGKILVGEGGMTLYMFTKDGPDQSNCDLECLANWPPLLTQGKPILSEGVDPALIGTATLADGSLIVTYNQMPLYYWAGDAQPGETSGQDVGHVWYVVSVNGTPVMVQAAPPANNNDGAPPEDKGGNY